MVRGVVCLCVRIFVVCNKFIVVNRMVVKKKFELMLTRRAKAYSSSGSVV